MQGNNSIDHILARLRQDHPDPQRRGQAFEKLTRRYLLASRLYKSQFESVDLWSDWASKNGIDGKDDGIDLIAEDHNGKLSAIQCKGYKEENVIRSENISTFMSYSGRIYNGKTIDQRYVFTTTDNWSPNALKHIENQNPPCQLINLSRLRSDRSVDWRALYEDRHPPPPPHRTSSQTSQTP